MRVDSKKDAAFSFSGVPYFHRFSKNDQHEYTPSGQEDLKAWKDMVTIHYYPRVKDGEALAATAGAVLENYKAARGMVLKTDSVPRTKEKPAEHLIAVVFGRPEFMEAAFARFRMHDGIGMSVVYSHRIYGTKAGNQMSAWLKKNGPATEASLMKWDAMPKPPSPSRHGLYHSGSAAPSDRLRKGRLRKRPAACRRNPAPDGRCFGGRCAADALVPLIEASNKNTDIEKWPETERQNWNARVLAYILGPGAASGFLKDRIDRLVFEQRRPAAFPQGTVPVGVRIARLEAVRSRLEAHAQEFRGRDQWLRDRRGA
jgi:hypothetical protein